MDNFYSKNIEQIYQHFKSSQTGLTNKQANIYLKKYGANEIKEKEKKSKARVFLEQFQDLLVVILIAAAVVSTFIGELQSTIVIFAVISINAILGTYQHFKAEKSLESLKSLSSPIVRVIRENIEQDIASNQVVVGDIVLVRAGDMIAADGRIISENDLEVNESSFTGESHAVSKTSKIIGQRNLIIGDQKNMLFTGTFCVKGSCRYIVCRTGMDTEIGKIANFISTTKVKKTPLQNSLDRFSKFLAIVIIAICVIVFILGIYRSVSILDSLMFAVALAVAAIPEALSTIVVIVLAIGTERMAAENSIIKELKAVEGLGCVNVICTDKTGTLTQNKMEIRDLKYYGPESFFLDCMAFSTTDNNATDHAILEYLVKRQTKPQAEKISEISFTSLRKMMSSLYRIDGKNMMFTKGADEAIIPRLSYIKTEFGLQIIQETKTDEISNQIHEATKKGLRVIVFAYKDIGYKDFITKDDEKDLIYVGMISLVDPLRNESKAAVHDCIEAGIKPVMLTGDHKDTALFIAKESGIYQSGDMVITGPELDKITNNDLYRNIDKISVFARLTPSHKIKIVETWQKHGAIVAMTGDGINDAPALRQADIGISMGKSGTEVAKEASSIILTDDNFSTIIKAVANGRSIYQNIQNAIRFLLSGNFAGILIVLYASLVNLPIPFLAVHLLFINLLTDSLPAIAIGMEEGNNKDIIKHPPRKSNESFLNKSLLSKVVIEGILIAAFVIFSYFEGLKSSVGAARTMAFATLCIARLFHSFNCVRARSILISGLRNVYLILSFLIGMVLINMVLFIPELRSLIVVSELTLHQIYCIYAFSIMPTIILQMRAIIKYAV